MLNLYYAAGALGVLGVLGGAGRLLRVAGVGEQVLGFLHVGHLRPRDTDRAVHDFDDVARVEATPQERVAPQVIDAQALAS